MTFKKIYIYIEVLFISIYPFNYQNCYICSIVDKFVKRSTLEKNIYVIMVLQSVSFI